MQLAQAVSLHGNTSQLHNSTCTTIEQRGMCEDEAVPGSLHVSVKVSLVTNKQASFICILICFFPINVMLCYSLPFLRLRALTTIYTWIFEKGITNFTSCDPGGLVSKFFSIVFDFGGPAVSLDGGFTM